MTRVYLAAYRDGMSTRYQEVGPEDMGAEAFMPEGAVVWVKPLEWREKSIHAKSSHDSGGYSIEASSVLGTYRIDKFNSVPHLMLECGVRKIELQEGADDEAAKAAAQADYEARIRAALDLTTEPEPTPEPGC